MFVIPKKSGKWRLLHDLRKINEVMEDTGALQPGLPSPSMIPRDWDVLTIDLKDCFFTIPLPEQDATRFAFSVPSVNKAEPMKRYHWTVLPQGMKNSPTMCQIVVGWALKPVREKWPQYIIYHYMDDILLAGSQLNKPELIDELTITLKEVSLQIALEKVQCQSPWNYLGRKIMQIAIFPQKLQLRTEIKTNIHMLLYCSGWKLKKILYEF